MNYDDVIARQKRLHAAYDRATRESALYGAAPKRSLGESIPDWAVRIGCDLTVYGAAPSDVVWDDARYQPPAPRWTATPPSEEGDFWTRTQCGKRIVHVKRNRDGELVDSEANGRDGPTDLATMTAYLGMEWWPVKLEPPP